MKRMRLLWVIVLAVLAANAAQAKKVRLEYKLKPGMEFNISASMKQEMSQELMGQSQTTVTKNELKYLLRVIEITEEGNFLLEEKLEAMKMKIENPMINMEFDSQSGEEAPVELAFYTKIIGVPVLFVVTPQGELKEIRDAEEYLGIMEEAMASIEGAQQQMVAAIGAQFASLDGLKKQISNQFFKYPVGKTKVGSSWSEETSENFQMINLTSQIENVLVSAGKEKATIKQSVDLNQMEMEGMEMEGMTMNYELSGRKEGGLEVDLSNGMMTTMDFVTDISGVISIESPQLPAPMSIPMSIKMTESFKMME